MRRHDPRRRRRIIRPGEKRSTMCKDYALNFDTGQIVRELNAAGDGPATIWDGPPYHFAPQDHIRITDQGFLIRPENNCFRVEVLPWAWEDRDHYLFNLSVGNRSFANSRRCLIAATGFYGYTMATNPAGKPQDQHLFRLKDHAWFWIAGIIRHGAFAMLTAGPSPTMVQFRQAQPCILTPQEGLNWLQSSESVPSLMTPLPKNAFNVSTLRSGRATRSNSGLGTSTKMIGLP